MQFVTNKGRLDMHFKHSIAAGMLVSAAAIAPSHAVTFTGNAVGSWLNPTATGSTFTIANNDNAPGSTSVASFSFGTPAAAGDTSNLFTFNGVGSGNTSGFMTSSNAPFAIGMFTYRNGTTTGSSYPFGNSGIQLGIALTLTAPLMNTSTFSYNFGIDITPNTTGNATLDADTVTIANGTTATTFSVDGTTYTLALLGFSKDNGLTFTNTFIAPEETTTGAQVYATITTNLLAVPEPTSLAVLGTSVLGLGLIRWRKA